MKIHFVNNRGEQKETFVVGKCFHHAGVGMQDNREGCWMSPIFILVSSTVCKYKLGNFVIVSWSSWRDSMNPLWVTFHPVYTNTHLQKYDKSYLYKPLFIAKNNMYVYAMCCFHHTTCLKKLILVWNWERPENVDNSGTWWMILYI